jgi:hypothetical protein
MMASPSFDNAELDIESLGTIKSRVVRSQPFGIYPAFSRWDGVRIDCMSNTA